MSQIILDSANDLIQGDFDNATLSQRTRLQTSTVNATTGVYVVPNGTATSASVQISNAADPTNASKLVVATNGSTDTQIVSGANGSGTYLPLSIYTNNDIRLQVNNSGALGVRTGPGTVGFGTSGQFLTSNGSGAGVSWTTAPTPPTPPSPQIQTEIFTGPGTWTRPSTVTQVRVTVVGGGGAATGGGPNTGGYGGLAVALCPVSAPVAITVGVGAQGFPTTSAGTSSFGSLVSATGGGNNSTPGTVGTPGTGTVTTGTVIKTGISIGNITGLGNTQAGNGGYINGLAGINVNPSTTNPSALTYSTSLASIAGAGGRNGTSPSVQVGGVSGAVVVEWVG